MQWTGSPRSLIPCLFASTNANKRVIQSRFFSVTTKKSRSSSGLVPWYAVEPVIATRRGAVEEVIEHGHSGVIVDDYRIMAAALDEADRLDPHEIRRYAEQRFAPERMVGDYLRAYREALPRARDAEVV